MGTETTSQLKYVGDGNPDGIVIGKTTSQKLSFWAATPVVKQTISNAAVATTVAVSTASGAITSWGFAGSTQANAIVSLVNEIRALIVTLGLGA